MCSSTSGPPSLPSSFVKAAGVLATSPCSRTYARLPSSATATAIVFLWTSRPTYITDWLIVASMQEGAPDQPDTPSDPAYYETGAPSLRRTCGLAIDPCRPVKQLRSVVQNWTAHQPAVVNCRGL